MIFMMHVRIVAKRTLTDEALGEISARLMLSYSFA